VRLAPGALVVVHLANPTEKFWGVLEALEPVGATFRAISLDVFEEWMTELARQETPTLGLSTQFVPLFRLERIFLDEPVGEVPSYRQRLERRTGRPVEALVGGFGDPSAEAAEPS